MQKLRIKGQLVFAHPDDHESAILAGHIAIAATKMLKKHWSLSSPGAVRVYLITDLVKFRLHSAPWPQKIIRTISLPLWRNIARDFWFQAKGVAEPYYSRPAIGIKPPRLLDTTMKTPYGAVMVDEPGLVSTLRNVICHEMTHVYTASRKLPRWLNEGLAVLASELFVGMPLVKPESLALLKPRGEGRPPESLHWINIRNDTALIYEYVRGYWITRYLEETYPRLLRKIIIRMRSHVRIHKTIADQLSIPYAIFWADIDAVVAKHFSQTMAKPSVFSSAYSATSLLN